MASWIFSSASASVTPCDQQPGSPGQATLYPSSDCCKTILYRMTLLYCLLQIVDSAGTEHDAEKSSASVDAWLRQTFIIQLFLRVL